MAEKKSLDERIAEAEKKLGKIKAQKILLEKKKKEKERKDRTRRLIQVGGIFSSIGIDTTEKADRFKTLILQSKEIQKSLSSIDVSIKEKEEEDSIESS